MLASLVGILLADSTGMKKLLSAFAVLLALATPLACGELETICTLIGCVDQLRLEVVDANDAALTVRTATITAGDGSRVVIDCGRPGGSQVVSRTGRFNFGSGEVGCSSPMGLVVEASSWSETSVTVDLVALNDQAYSGETQLELQRSRPNGPDCEPECVSASGKVTVGN